MLRCVWICGRGGELDVCWGWACFLLTLKGVLTCGVYHLRVCFDCVCLSICTYKNGESLWPHKGVNTPRAYWKRFLQRLCFHCGRHPPWEMIHTCTDLKMVWKHTHTHTSVHIQIDFISSLHHWPGLQNQFNPDNHLKRRVFIGIVSKLDLVKPK